MADDVLFDLTVLASDHTFYDDKALCVTVHTNNGLVQFLANHAASIYAITPGPLIIRKPDHSEIEVVSGVGAIIYQNNKAQILVETCETPEQLDERRAQEALERAEERMRQKQSMREYQMSQAAMARALARLQFKGKNYKG